MIKCPTCNADIAASAKTCPSCGAKRKRPIYTKIWFWIFIIFVVGMVGASLSTDKSNDTTRMDDTKTDNAVSSKSSVFDGDPGISATGEMGVNIIGQPTLTISIENQTDKELKLFNSMQLLLDVYGDEITKWSSQNYLYTDTSIGAGSSTTITYQFIKDSVKTVRLYVYSVYFADGTEWGDKDAIKSVILKSAPTIEVHGES